MREPRCERCTGESPTTYAVSPFPRVGGFWLCAPCRAEWLRVQEVPSLDTASPPVERRAMLWCPVLQQRVRVLLVEKENAPDESWIPKGWGLRRCLDQRFACVGRECPFAIVRGRTP